ncbi:hypothetical protein BV898_19392 [Hypsibius exemplaris]|uniref:Major facilitator superfamily associated domain-containing protein n=1 Tax=Hypsibius exemplaris TaxID=2072580 RepID=A0A9X6NJH7_HYPEX|nr:hypothetical protein BV898_19392 [Hypsibius exemplaris]
MRGRGQPSCFVNCSLKRSFGHMLPGMVERASTNYVLDVFVFRVISSIALASVFPLLDAATIQMTIDHHGDIGRVKMYSLLAICVWPPLSGVMIDKLGMGFAPAFYVYGILHVASVVVVLLMSLNVKLPAENIWSHVGVLLKNPKVAVFVIVFFFIASAWGVLDSFLFWFMEDTFASQSLWRILLLRKVYGGFLCFARNRIGGKATISQ